jgi:hypothetical protein
MVGDRIGGRMAVGLLLLICVCTARSGAVDYSESGHLYQQAVTQLTSMAKSAVNQIDQSTAAWLPEVQQLLDAGQTDTARALARQDIKALTQFSAMSIKTVRARLMEYDERLRELGAFNLIMNLNVLVNARLVPAVQSECDGAVRQFKALFADGSV